VQKRFFVCRRGLLFFPFGKEASSPFFFTKKKKGCKKEVGNLAG